MRTPQSHRRIDLLRRFTLCVLVLAGFALSATPLRAAEKEAPRRPFRISLSISPFSGFMLAQGVEYTDGETKAATLEELQRLYIAHGATEIYARINTRRTYPGGVANHSLDGGLEKARLAKKLGIPFNPELGLFRTYGDIRCQTPPDFSDYPEIEVPGSWMALTIEQMAPPLRQYGAVVAKEILDTGVEVNVWDLGNEVEFGAAGVAPPPLPGADACEEEEGGGWYRPPDAIDPEIGKQNLLSIVQMPEPERIQWLQKHVWHRLARILAAVADGIRSVDRDARFSTHASGYLAERPAMAVAFYQALKDGGFLPDELGYSFYPSASADPPDRLGAFVETVKQTWQAFERPIMVAEFGYPSEKMTEGPFKNWNNALQSYPLSPEGQAGLAHDLASWGVTAGLGGIRPWAPDLLVPGWSPMTLFQMKDKKATALPSLGAIAKGSANPDRNALKGLRAAKQKAAKPNNPQ